MKTKALEFLEAVRSFQKQIANTKDFKPLLDDSISPEDRTIIMEYLMECTGDKIALSEYCMRCIEREIAILNGEEGVIAFTAHVIRKFSRCRFFGIFIFNELCNKTVNIFFFYFPHIIFLHTGKIADELLKIFFICN